MKYSQQPDQNEKKKKTQESRFYYHIGYMYDLFYYYGVNGYGCLYIYSLRKLMKEKSAFG